jgi:phosphoribosylformylglycinamidine synthase
MGIVGLMKTAAPKPVTFVAAGHTVMLVGGLGDCDLTHFGGTQYAKQVLNQLWGRPPRLDMHYEKRVQACIRELVREGAVASAHDLSDGGLAVALAESCFGAEEMGAELSLDSDLAPELLLFHEGSSRVLVATASPERVLASSKKSGIAAVDLGATGGNRLTIRNREKVLIDAPVSELKQRWSHSLEEMLHDTVVI